MEFARILTEVAIGPPDDPNVRGGQESVEEEDDRLVRLDRRFRAAWDPVHRQDVAVGRRDIVVLRRVAVRLDQIRLLMQFSLVR